MIATIHLAEPGLLGTLRAGFIRPSLGDVPGLRWADTSMLIPLAHPGPPPMRHAALFAFWDDEDAVDRFLQRHPVAQRFAGGFQARMRPLRAFGDWPGLPPDIARARVVPHEGPLCVLTLAHLRLSQAPRFLKAGTSSQEAARDHEGMIWGSVAGRVPFVATLTFWRDSDAIDDFAYSARADAHRGAMAEQQRKDFHRRSTFVRFALTRVEGAIGGPRPLSASSFPDLPAVG